MSSRKWVKIFAIPSLLLVFLCLPVTTYALGLGGIKLSSALSEILDAEIELVGASESDLEGLKIGLASRDAFLRAGIDRSSVINSMRFVVKKRPNGTYYIKVKSRRPIREPFLNFLMEMNWRNGRMLREYTLLLDPPGLVQRPQTTVVQTPKLQQPKQAAPAAAPAPAASPFVDVPAAKPTPDPYITDNELFPKRDIKDVSPVVEAEPEHEHAHAPEPEPIPEPIASEPEPIVPADVMPEPELEPVAAPKGESGKVKSEFKDSGQVYDTPFTDVAPADDELFPRITLHDYDPDTSGDHTKPGLTPEPLISEPADEAGVNDAPVVEMEMDSAPQPERVAGDYDYGITSKGDNVWKIAEQLRQDPSVTVYQMMMAILQSNPEAFVEGNVHRLKSGQVIRIEDPSIIRAISKDEAAQQYLQQTAAWDEYRQRVAGQATTQPIVAGEVGQDSVAMSSTPQADISIEAPDGENLSAIGTSANANNEIAQLQQDLQRIGEQAEAERGKNSALNQRLKEMEAELAGMQRSLSIKNDELAALQQQQNTAPTAPAPVSEIALPESKTATPEPSADAAAVPEIMESTPADVAVIPDTAQQQTESVTTEPLEVPITQSQQPAAAQQSAGFMDSIMGTLGGIIAALTGGGLLFVVLPVVGIVLLLVVLIIVRRRRNDSDSFQESILSGVAPLEEVADVSSADAPASETSSFLSDFAISGVGAIQSDDNEVDPLTEADVFMAYGRYEAAEDRLKDAVASDPDRHELKVKLLELYNTTKNRPAFEATAEELYASLGSAADSDPNWQKAVALGKQVAPDNPMFSNAEVVVPAAASEDILASPSDSDSPDSQVMDIGLNTGVFDTSDFAAIDDDVTRTKPAPAADSAELDFSLDTEANDLDIGAGDAGDASLDFSFEEPAVEAESGDKMDDEPTMSMTMDSPSMASVSMDTEMEANENPTMSMTFDAEGLNLDESTTDLDMDIGEQSMELNLDATDAVDLAINTDADEVSTKLDLARAYIDMGDSEGARSILDEVITEGSDQQKQEAQQLVSQIG